MTKELIEKNQYYKRCIQILKQKIFFYEKYIEYNNKIIELLNNNASSSDLNKVKNW